MASNKVDIIYHRPPFVSKVFLYREKADGSLFSKDIIMTEEIKISFNEKTGNGGLTLYANPFGTGKKFYGRFERDVISMENLVSRVQQKNPGADEIIINTAISYIKREILAALKQGLAVNLLDLGELYIAATGSTASDSAKDVSDISLSVKFSASQLLKESITDVSIGKVVFSDTAPAITKIFNWFTGKESSVLTAGKNVILEGKSLKLGTSASGLFLAPVDEKGDVSDNEAEWINCTDLVRQNTPKKIDFYLPDEAVPGDTFRIVIKSNYINGTTERKQSTFTYSDVVTIG